MAEAHAKNFRVYVALLNKHAANAGFGPVLDELIQESKDFEAADRRCRKGIDQALAECPLVPLEQYAFAKDNGQTKKMAFYKALKSARDLALSWQQVFNLNPGAVNRWLKKLQDGDVVGSPVGQARRLAGAHPLLRRARLMDLSELQQRRTAAEVAYKEMVEAGEGDAGGTPPAGGGINTDFFEREAERKPQVIPVSQVFDARR